MSIQYHPCKGCGRQVYRGQPRCAECREKLSRLRKKAWRIYHGLGGARAMGDWYSFFASYANQPMPQTPEFLRVKPPRKKRTPRCTDS